MEKKSYYALDIAKYICAFFVITVHTAPFADINTSLHMWVTQILARTAVPLYFIIAGYLFFSKIDTQREWNDQVNIYRLKRYSIRIFTIYGIWSLIYFPIRLFGLYQANFSLDSILGFVRDILFLGTYYHLWFLPALVIGLCIVYFLRKWCTIKQIIIYSLCLYFIGMGFNIYLPLLEGIPILSTICQVYQKVFVTTRNGFFFAPIFIALGAYYANIQISLRYSLKKSFVICVGALLLFIIEACLLQSHRLLTDNTSMYASLLIFCPSILLVLLQLHLRKRKIYTYMRKTSLLIYVSHLLFIILCDKVLPDLALWEVCLFSSLCSIIFSTMIYVGAKKFKILEILC